MKVVLFCGGQGMRLRGGNSDPIPKPLVEVGSRPVLWHLMRYYAHYGHKDFILCLGYGGTAIKNYFLNYDERIHNDFVYAEGGHSIELLGKDIHDWRITFVDTGNNASIGERLRRVQAHLGKDEMFLANYADGLSDLNLTTYIDDFVATGKIATFLSVPAPHTFHIVHADGENYVQRLEHVSHSMVRINGGFFVLRRQIFDHLHKDEELVIEAFARLIPQRQLLAVPFDGFWQNMDTFKDKIQLDEMVAKGRGPWEAWRK